MNVIDAQCVLKAFTSRLCSKRSFQKPVLKNFARAVRESANAGNGTAMLVVQRDDLIRKETYRRDFANEFMDKLGHIRVFCRVRPPLTGVGDSSNVIKLNENDTITLIGGWSTSAMKVSNWGGHLHFREVGE
ncbi:hypothetical protein Tco_1371987 [Tanacetum coccineum]